MAEGVTIAVLLDASYVTCPGTGDAPGPVNVNVALSIDDAVIALLKVTVTSVLGQAPPVPLRGIAERTVGGARLWVCTAVVIRIAAPRSKDDQQKQRQPNSSIVPRIFLHAHDGVYCTFAAVNEPKRTKGLFRPTGSVLPAPGSLVRDREQDQSCATYSFNFR